jgi:uncharacterized membrane protein
MAKFPFEFIILKMFIAENFRENENFRETKFRENLLIFAFRENGKNHFRFNPNTWEFVALHSFVLHIVVAASNLFNQ